MHIDGNAQAFEQRKAQKNLRPRRTFLVVVEGEDVNTDVIGEALSFDSGEAYLIDVTEVTQSTGSFLRTREAV